MTVAVPKSRDLSDISYYDWTHLLESYRCMVDASATVLEIGASDLERTKQINKHCANLIGVELMLERKPADFSNVRYVIGDWQHLSSFIPANSIDIAISSHVLEHVKDDLKALQELYTVLKPGGAALINTPNRKRLTRTVIELFTGPKKFPYEEHEREYVESDLTKLIQSSSFKKFKIIPVAFGLHGGPVYLYTKKVWWPVRKLANFWELQLIKDEH